MSSPKVMNLVNTCNCSYCPVLPGTLMPDKFMEKAALTLVPFPPFVYCLTLLCNNRK